MLYADSGFEIFQWILRIRIRFKIGFSEKGKNAIFIRGIRYVLFV
ncbi:hypothetical protein LEP1GSC191_0367 [Leptospira borgpetersenii serovar Mini str. 201000851]|uniref:Uncharacterized protein n=3 Tax=Leptospira borgpetersenii TaxID=174 RepID=M3FAA7_LEPBO|nr:hypothetical protein LEP1GSC128_0518 [Leptospira borgpetersenii str. 200801926]EMF98847.1 hypothetical protein LEP1GSC123_3124 [Leptospira borgpetersenii str. 200701203]EMK09862.1 hypothetical protein LEP1GSC066_2788 [Leptospira sp. serovar Kenya str. Sh9]EMN11236.1 hypothetical protein LEP1GSC055_2900 [Leptospira borgpetersenii str. Brem 307]EMN17488.1 hypothetical protein LEP1GSC056_3144 [Leptospira borgpetersenii str. Brem 328]ENO63920.1 hypothetical protein LEP1GSC191_0367 [Leptospira b